MQNQTLAELWLDAIFAEGAVVQASVETYRYDLRCYLGFLSSRRLDLGAVTRHDLVDYLLSISCTLSPATILHRRAVLGSLHGFLARESLAESDPTALLSPMISGTTIPKSISLDDVSKMLDRAHERASDETVGLYRQAGYARRAALLETIYATGMRISECIGLRSKNLRRGSMQIKGKGSKERLVFINDRALQAISKWNALALRYKAGDRPWIFYPVRDPLRCLTRQAVDLEIKEAARDSGLANSDMISAHLLRHAFASHMLANGADLRSLQEMLGHSDIGTTEIYLHVLDHRRTNMVRDLHPLNDQSFPA